MSKNNVMAALATLRESGLQLTEEQENALEEFTAQAMTSEAVKVFDRKLIPDSVLNSTEWATRVFDWASEVETQITGENVGRGRGEVHEQVFRVETPSGSLKVSLTRPVE